VFTEEECEAFVIQLGHSQGEFRAQESRAGGWPEQKGVFVLEIMGKAYFWIGGERNIFRKCTIKGKKVGGTGRTTV